MKVLAVFKGTWVVLVGMVFLLQILVGCQDDGLPDQARTLDDAYAFIVGEWEWKKSLVINRRQVNTIVQTPESEGITKQYIFRRDTTMQYVENGIVIQNSEYEIEINESKFRVQFLETGSSVGVSINADTLVFINRVFGDNEFYIRK